MQQSVIQYREAPLAMWFVEEFNDGAPNNEYRVLLDHQDQLAFHLVTHVTGSFIRDLSNWRGRYLIDSPKQVWYAPLTRLYTFTVLTMLDEDPDDKRWIGAYTILTLRGESEHIELVEFPF